MSHVPVTVSGKENTVIHNSHRHLSGDVLLATAVMYQCSCRIRAVKSFSHVECVLSCAQQISELYCSLEFLININTRVTAQARLLMKQDSYRIVKTQICFMCCHLLVSWQQSVTSNVQGDIVCDSWIDIYLVT